MFVVIFTVSVIVVGLRIRFDFTADLDQEVYGEIPYLVFLAVPFFALTAILCLLPRFDDNVFIATEMRSVIGVLLFILVAFGAQEFVEHQNEDDDDAKNVGIAVNVIYYAVIESSNTICILIATAFVMKKVEPLLTDQIMRRSHYLGATKLSPEMASYVQLNDDLMELQLESMRMNHGGAIQEEEEVDVSLFEVMEHSKAFHLFMHFVATEFSMECLLSFVEFVQFKQWMIRHLRVTRTEDAIKQKSIELFHSLRDRTSSLTKSEIAVDLHYGSNGQNEDDGGFLNIEFPANVPKSRIVFDEDYDLTTNKFTDRSKHKIYKLYSKYIRKDSELEINISGRSRHALAVMMDDYDQWMNDHKYDNLDAVFLMHILDKCIEQMYDLLTASYRRFKHSSQYQKLRRSVFVE